MGEELLHLVPVVGEGVVQHPHAAMIATSQTQRVNVVVVMRLGILQLVKVLVQESDNPRSGSFLRSILSLADNDCWNAADDRNGCQQTRRLGAPQVVNIALQQRVVVD